MGHPQLMMNWDHQQHTQQYYEQLHLINAAPPHLAQMTADKCYQQMNYHQGHPLMTHSNLIEKDNNDIVLIKVCSIGCLIKLSNIQYVLFVLVAAATWQIARIIRRSR